VQILPLAMPVAAQDLRTARIDPAEIRSHPIG
jgi:hypothetical protein